MSLDVWSARVSSRDPDRLDITRKSGGPAGVIFAPSWRILRPALDRIRIASQMDGPGREAMEADTWARYVPAYLAEMRASYKADRAAWDALLARPRVVLACYCTDPRRCHRTVLGRDILPRLGATWCGERVGE